MESTLLKIVSHLVHFLISPPTLGLSQHALILYVHSRLVQT